MGIVFLRKTLNKFIRTGKLADLSALFFRGVLLAPAQIVEDRTGKQDIFLQNYRYFITQHFHIIVSDIDATDTDTAFRHIIQTGDQIDKAGFTTARSADNTDRFSRMDMQIDIL